MPSHGLGVKILGLFKEAFEAGRSDVAEHLLCALEALERAPRSRSALREAYLSVGESVARAKARQH
jgi:hypothetical protein